MESLVKVNKFSKTGNGKKIIHIFLSIFAGSIIYILFREKNLLMFKRQNSLLCDLYYICTLLKMADSIHKGNFLFC